MLTRLKVSGFKNLVDVDVRFGPFTCVAGANGVGKSNLFDAIRFLSALADRPLVEAVQLVRDEGGRTGDIRDLFHRAGDKHDEEMSFVAEMIVPPKGIDDLGQPTESIVNFLRYTLVLAYRKNWEINSLIPLEVIKEELVAIHENDVLTHLGFVVDDAWLRSAIRSRPIDTRLIWAEERAPEFHLINRHSLSGPFGFKASDLPRTVLSTANAAEMSDALLARREMQSWRLLQLEPSALRKPDEFTAPSKLGEDGSHLAATLNRLARKNYGKNGDTLDETAGRVYGQVANRLAQLIEDVDAVSVDRDDRRELLTLQVMGQDGTTYSARALSDGTLRFLALAVLELDPEMQGVLCLEEPENGIHPKRIPAMLQLLQDIAVDVDEPVDQDNPLRQVIVNTHSPAVVSLVPDGSLLVAEVKDTVRDETHFNRVCFSYLSDTWRERAANDEQQKLNLISRGELAAYLNPTAFTDQVSSHVEANSPRRRRVIERSDLQLLLPHIED